MLRTIFVFTLLIFGGFGLAHAAGSYAQKYIYVFDITGNTVQITNSNPALDSGEFGVNGACAPNYYTPFKDGVLDTGECVNYGVAYDSNDKYLFAYGHTTSTAKDLVLVEKHIPVNDSGEPVGRVSVKRLVVAKGAYADTSDLRGQHVDEMSQIVTWILRKYNSDNGLMLELNSPNFDKLTTDVKALFQVNTLEELSDVEKAQRDELYRTFNFQNIEQSDLAEGSVAFIAIFDAVHTLLKSAYSVR
ncbi:hypothetical protein [Chrysiogenes arsenatis]|uniref:hypothetical protein n=1 Tax=Chrysiogenes arsenatis TaxID=309797 RepID=UPI0004168650|nr:hypothetical protein [Chrysiogenes arsenatis]